MSEAIKVIAEQKVLGKEFNIYGTIEEPLFLAKDVAKWIEHSDVHKMLQSVDDDEKGRNNVPTLGGDQECWFLTGTGEATLDGSRRDGLHWIARFHCSKKRLKRPLKITPHAKQTPFFRGL